MANRIRFILALHNHQPVGNFDHVIQQAFEDSYRPFLDLFAGYDSLKIALHTSGSLMEWLDAHQPEYVDRLAELVAAGRIEIIGGAFFEPILAMIPRRDRVGQIRRYTRWLENRLGATVRGMWMPERVWEQAFTSDLATAGIKYTILDDFHFKAAGLTDDELTGHLITEDEGRTLSIFPGSEPLRYLIPFGQPEETIEHLREIADRHPGAVVVFGDDGEKFGTWPETKKHVYDDGWLVRFFDCLAANQDWIQVTTPAEAIDSVPPVGKIFLPDASYREMTEWSLPAEQLSNYERLSHEMGDDPRWQQLKRFAGGGFWRNFKRKYPESDEMYARMMMVSRRLEETCSRDATREMIDPELVDQARTHLYRAQCNCSYWHGAFGGIYLPHLRNAVYSNLITADNLLDQATGRTGSWIEAAADDYNFDSRQEVVLSNDRLLAMFAPGRGGRMTELDVRAIRHNLLATLTRRPEAYHEKILGGGQNGNDECASIHDRVVFKQADLDQRIQYDGHERKSLLDLFYDVDTSLESVAAGEAPVKGDFLEGCYEARVRRNPDRIQIQLARTGRIDDLTIKVTKGITLDAGSPTLRLAYMLEGLPQDRALRFAVEMNFAGMPAGADDRYFYAADGSRLGHLGAWINTSDTQGLSLVDEWLGIDVALRTSRPTGFWAFPVEAVSQSEGGFELVHQSVAVLPHWEVTGDGNGRWGVTMYLDVDTSMAESRREAEMAATT